jgi:hypothetical protein
LVRGCLVLGIGASISTSTEAKHGGGGQQLARLGKVYGSASN